MKRKQTMLIISSCVLIVAILVIALVINLLWKVSGISLVGQLTEPIHMANYLEKKYNQDFVIDSVERGAQLGLGADVTVIGKAHLATDPSLAFDISRESGQDYSTYRDTLLSTLWSRQAINTARDFLENNFKDIETFKVTVSPGEKLRQSIHGGMPNLSDVKNDGQDGYGYRLVVYSSTKGEGTQPSDFEASRVKLLIDFIKQQTSGYGSISYYYGPPSDRYSNRDHMYHFSLSGEELKSANVKDIKDYFKKI